MTFDWLRGSEAAFSSAEFSDRQTRARAAIAAAGFGALILTGPEAIYWLTGRQTAGYFAFQALVLPVEGAPVLLVRQLEMAGTRANTWLDTVVPYQDGEDPVAALVAMIHGMDLSDIAIERDGWFVSPRVMAALDMAFGGSLHDGSGLIAPLRAVKSSAELDAIRHAARYAEAGIAAGIATCRAGADENAVAAAMMSAAITSGSETMAMEPLVSSGPRSGLPHMTWRRKVLGDGDCVFLEIAGSHARYHSALMRSVWIGKPPSEALSMHSCACDALAAALDVCRPGQICAAPHRAAQRVIDKAGYTAAFRKRIGYSMGVAFAPDWGEGGILSLFEGVEREIEPGMVFHLPATLRDYGNFTVGASETVIISPDGACEVLSSIRQDMQIC